MYFITFIQSLLFKNRNGRSLYFTDLAFFAYCMICSAHLLNSAKMKSIVIVPGSTLRFCRVINAIYDFVLESQVVKCSMESVMQKDYRS